MCGGELEIAKRSYQAKTACKSDKSLENLKEKNMGDLTSFAVHRCRFIDFAPSPINALAFPPLPLPSLKGKTPENERARTREKLFGTLAVGRANGDIELCEWSGEEGAHQSAQAWVVQKTLAGPSPSKVDSLAFTLRHPDTFTPTHVPSHSDLRLFSSGGGSEVVEWDLQRGCVRRTISSQGGSIWCIAANPASTLLALGCEDGSVHLLSLAADTLTHHRRFDRVKSRLLSLAWGPPVPRPPRRKNDAQKNGDLDASDDEDDDEDEWSDSWLVTGGSDSCLRKWNVATGGVLYKMGTDKVRGERTLVWAVGVLGDGTIVSGDSLGSVKFWDSKMCTQLQSFTAHGADVLCLTIGPEGHTVYTSGVDQKTVQFSYVASDPTKPSSAPSSPSRWIQSCSRRMHSHDVRSLAIWPPYSPLPHSYNRKIYNGQPIAPVLASAGLDMSVVLTPALSTMMTTSMIAPRIVNPLATSAVSTFEDAYYRRVPYSSTICVARRARLIACMQETGLNIWRILERAEVDSDPGGLNGGEERSAWKKMVEMDIHTRTNLIACALSDDGRWLVVSDLYEAKLFELITTPAGDLKPRRIKSFASAIRSQLSPDDPSLGGSAFAFTPDSSKLVMATATTAYILIVDLSMEDPVVLRRFDQHRNKGPADGRMKKKSKMNGTWDDDDPSSHATAAVNRLAVSPDGQWLATSDDLCRTYIFNLDSSQYHTTLPSLPFPPNVLSFLPENPHILLSALPNNSLHLFDIERNEVPPWARELCRRLPKRFTDALDPVLGLSFVPARSSTVGVDQGSLEQPQTAKDALFWSSTWICKVKLDVPSSWGSSKKRRQPEERDARHLVEVSVSEEAANFKMVTHFRSILAVHFLDSDELVVVERPLVDVLSKLPPAYFKPKYGRT
ncbi:hypothetical protein SERLA73DRAFT_102051 [Serpula lacrymans var. lacrymans S7.3]|uniref:Uncharacterized protein n=2 Tax=Serpula lacrymans var. lacrymans TaxID=341189 RepID=F8PJE3_SERL3|nr:uncharacterized protein SERLADRAFT_445414 [Serpula lacrymans var. lacrymans S7.9]EGO03768.1 hypothetical protein SERLA73DRAFT_102051 [Serpula lacrymans var. lacrymans S7.3]EGO29632.1 hypothetical protein SERLADRAFT_445414 [Serpula lacrymans var. lacrymans S7.9]